MMPQLSPQWLSKSCSSALPRTLRYQFSARAPPARTAYVSLQASSSSTSASTGGDSASGSAASSSDQQRYQQQRIQRLFDILQDAVALAVERGPRGIIRGIQVSNALLSLTREQAQSGTLDPPPRLLRKLFTKLGTTYIKLGQFIASSPTLFPPDYVAEFQYCLDQTPPTPWRVIEREIESCMKENGVSVSSVFSELDQVCLASASVAQVHAGVLKESGKDVVVKVLKPGVSDIITTDMSVLTILTRLVEWLVPSLSRTSLSLIFTDITESMKNEVDLRKELRNINTFNRFLDSTGGRSVANAPGVYEAISNDRVLVMDRVFGVPLTDLDSIKNTVAMDVQPEQILINALNVWIQSVVDCETFHADVHAGNLLVQPDGRVAFIDFGIVGAISPTTWTATQALLNAFQVRDYEVMARALATIGATDDDVNITQLARDLQELVEKLSDVDAQVVVSQDRGGGGVAATVQLDDGALNNVIVKLVEVGDRNGIKFPREFGLLLKQVLYFDRYTKLLAPDLEVLNDDRVNTQGSTSGSVYSTRSTSGTSQAPFGGKGKIIDI